jgi:hypothetical protein
MVFSRGVALPPFYVLYLGMGERSAAATKLPAWGRSRAHVAGLAD